MRRRSFVTGLVAGVAAGGILGVLLVALATASLPDQWVAVGTATAGGIGYLVAWLVHGRPVDVDAAAAPLPTRLAGTAPEPAMASDQVAAAPSLLSAPGADEIDLPEPEAALPATADDDDAEPVDESGGLLPAALIRLAGEATGRAAAIDEAGALLVAVGAVEPGYVAAMQARERSVSTHMGNLLAVPHGNHEALRLVRRSALALVRYPDTIDWHGNRVRFVVATAGVDDADQVRLVSRVAEVFLDDSAVARLEAAQTAGQAAEVFASAGG